ncbi:MAG: hypothetical protein ACE5DO_04800 [Desulfobacterales bacterium]
MLELRLRMNIIKRISETDYVRLAIKDKADLSAFKKRPSARVFAGLSVIGVSYLIGWPAISALGAISIYLQKPLLIAVGGPLTYGLSHLVFLLGLYLGGIEYAKVFLRWLTRIAMEKFIVKRF